MLINAKMPTNFGILTFISMINTTFENSAASDLVVVSLSMSHTKKMLGLNGLIHAHR